MTTEPTPSAKEDHEIKMQLVSGPQVKVTFVELLNVHVHCAVQITI